MRECKTKFTAEFARPIRPVVVCCEIVLCLAITVSVGMAQLNHIEAASRLLRQGQNKEAESEAHLAMRDPSTRALALSMLGTIYLQEGKYQQGTQFLTQALKLNPGLPGTLTTLGDAYVLQNKPLLARKSFEQALKVDPANNNARFDLAKLEASLHNYQKSLGTARPMLSRLLKSEDGLMLLATDYGPLGDKEGLASVARAWLELPSASGEASLQFGQVLAKYGMASEAKGIFRAVESKSTGRPSWILAGNLGKSYLQLGDLDAAERNFELALKLNPSCAPCDEGVAAVAEKKGNTEKALAYLLKAKRLDPENTDILFEFGKICLERNLVDDALAALTKAVSLRPHQDRYVYVLASANVANGNLPKAASLLGQLLQEHPEDPLLTYAVGTVYYLQGRYKDAESSLKQSLEKEPDQVAAPYYLSLTYSHLGQNDQAEAMLRKLIKNHPEYAPPYVKLGTIRAAEHDYGEAQEKLERAVQLDPGSIQAHYQLCLLFHLLGKTSESQQHCEKWKKLQAEHKAQIHLQLHLLTSPMN